MITTLVTGPTEYAVSLSEAKDHLRITHTDDEGYITSLIKAAQDRIELLTGRKLISQTWKYYLQEFPGENYIVLPYGQLTSVTHLKYTDSGATVNTDWDEDDEWTKDTDSDPGRIILKYGESWPTSTLAEENPIEIQFVCGWSTRSDVPEQIKHAIKIAISDLYENRESYMVGLSAQRLNTIDALLLPYRIFP